MHNYLILKQQIKLDFIITCLNHENKLLQYKVRPYPINLIV